MEPTPLPASLRIVLVAVAAVLAAVGVGGLATGAADESDLTTAGSKTSTTLESTDFTLGVGNDTTTTAAGGTATTVAGATATTAKPGGATGTTVAAVDSNACASPPETSTNPGPIQAPAVGIYSYVSCGSDGAVDDQTVKEGTSGGGKVRRLVSHNQQGIQLTETIAYGSDGVLQEALNVAAFGQQASCDWNPDVVEYPANLSVGAQWSAKSSCTTSFGQFKVDATGKITGRRSVTVGGTSVNAWVVERHLNLKTPQGDQVADETLYYDPSRGVPLYRKAVTSDGNGGKITVVLRLASLTPKPL